jgi:hypothetical protein
MYGRVVIYTQAEDETELEAKARATVIPIVTGTPGYISYGVMFDDDRVVSVSQWEPRSTQRRLTRRWRVGEVEHDHE